MIINENSLEQAFGILGNLYRSYKQYGNKKFLNCGGESLTYQEMVEKGSEFASFLFDSGIRKGDRVGIVMPNSCNWYVFLYGILRIGAVVVPFDPLLGEGELAALIKKAGVRSIICVPKHRGVDFICLFEKLLREDYDLKQVIVDGKMTENISMICYQNQVLQQKKIPDFELNEEDSNVFLCTTGSTGVSKIVDLDCCFYDDCLKKYGDYLGFAEENVKFYSAMPLYHAAGLGYGLCCMNSGSEMYYDKRFLPTKMLDLLEKEKITMILSTPTVMRVIRSHEKFADYKLENLKKIIFTGEALDTELVQAYIEKFGVQVLNILGSSENFIYLIWDSKKDLQYPVNCFTGISDLDVRIFDNETECHQGEQGIIKIKKQIMKGYYNEPELTNEVISEKEGERWFDSGDRGAVMEHNRISYLGRKKKVMKRGGNLVSFEEVEYAVGRNEKVALVVVTSEKDEMYGEKLTAYVQLKENTQLDKNDLFIFLRKEIAAYKIPDEIFYVDEIPKSSGKASVRRLKQMLEEGKLTTY